MPDKKFFYLSGLHLAVIVYIQAIIAGVPLAFKQIL